jgi:predicted nucleotidyltransferase
LRAKGVLHAAVFGSVARGEARPDSDVDVLVEIDPEKRIGMFAFTGIELDLCELMGKRVEIASVNALKPYAKGAILREKVDAF